MGPDIDSTMPALTIEPGPRVETIRLGRRRTGRPGDGWRTVTDGPGRRRGAGRLSPAVGHVVNEAEDYTGAIAGVHVDAIRSGDGSRPNCVLGVTGELVAVTTCDIGFPMITHSHAPDDRIVLAYVHQADRDSRWCAIPLEPGGVVVYGPGAEHVATNRPGLRFTFGITKFDLLVELADQAETAVELPARGSIERFGASPRNEGDA